MILLSMLMVAAPISRDELDLGDRLNQAHVECMFEVARSARRQHVPVADFSDLLAASCEAERERLHVLVVEILQRRGDSPTTAEAKWARLEAEGRESVERAYALPGG